MQAYINKNPTKNMHYQKASSNKILTSPQERQEYRLDLEPNFRNNVETKTYRGDSFKPAVNLGENDFL